MTVTTHPIEYSTAIEASADFAAFCELHQPRYRLVALLASRNEAEADGAVQAALGELATHWDDALASPSVSAYAWPLVKRRITDPHPALGELADDVLLGRILHLTRTQIAETTGRHIPRQPIPRRSRSY
ncbi:hypothetical protein [Kitasatospora sp. NPDC048407]|uniref:hypothetical protein n=1 Tax=Kitasatospora sp. NPDC048407 TaxID=3364051 RepID=UPI0037198AD4